MLVATALFSRQLFANAAMAVLARRREAVRQRAVLMMFKGERPHPRRAYRRRMHLHDAADDITRCSRTKCIVLA